MASTDPVNEENGKQNDSSNNRRRRKRRWGDAAPDPSATGTTATATATAETTTAVTTSKTLPADGKAKAIALQASVRARLEALKAKKKPAPDKPAPATLKRPLEATKLDLGAEKEQNKEESQPKNKKAKHYELDMSVTGPTFEPTVKKPAVKVNPYLAHREEKNETGEGEVEEDLLDERLIRSSKPRHRHKTMQFVEPGTFTEIAERKRLKAANAEQSGFVSGRKTGNFVNSSTMMSSIYGGDGLEAVAGSDGSALPPRAEASEKTTIPYVLEWWDAELLPSKLKKQVAAYEGKVLNTQAQSQMKMLHSAKKGVHIPSLINEEVTALRQRCFHQASLSYSKTAALIQHIVPVRPANAKAHEPEKQPTLFLTKRELKRQRKLRREEKQRELQDLQVAGLVPPPEPRLTLKNFIRVLGDQAYVDPSQMEAKVMAQIQARQRAHEARNAATKLTKEQRSEKRAKMLQEDTTGGVNVALFYVKDMSHPYHRTKVDLNAQQSNITGGVLECDHPRLACVICEGGPKAIKRYKRLMLVRMKWTGPSGAEEEDEDDGDDMDLDADDHEKTKRKFNKDNKCELVWEGMAVKRFFKGFVFQSCETSDEARKVLKSKGVGHFWDQILTHASGHGNKMQLKLLQDDDDDDNNSEGTS